MINPEGRYFATLYLPGEYRGAYFSDAHIEPHFAEGETSVAEFLERAKNPNLDIDDYYWKAMRQENPHAYKLLIQMLDLSGEEGSPTNDLNYARAFREIIDHDCYYKGNIDKALNEVAKLSARITDSGAQSDINRWTDYIRLISSIRASLAYDPILTSDDDNEWLHKEYVAWHNLVEVMAYYLDRLYANERYLAVPEVKNNIITQWLNSRKTSLEEEQEILINRQSYSVDSTMTDSLSSNAERQNFFDEYHYLSAPYYYDPMWNEIKPAFDSWVFARVKLAEQLAPHTALSYREYSRVFVDTVFSFIKRLQHPEYDPAV